MLDILAMPFGYLMKFCCYIAPNYLISLALFTLIIQFILCLIFGIKQQKNSVKQALLAPKVAAIRKKYAGRNDQKTMTEMQSDINKLYEENGYSQFGGCLPMLIQMPIILALYQVIRYPLRFICGVGMNDENLAVQVVKNFAGKIESVANAIPKGIELDKLNFDHTSNAQYEIIKYLNENGLEGSSKLLEGVEVSVLPRFGIGPFDLSAVPTFDLKHLSVLLLVPVLVYLTTVASQLITRKFMYQDPAMKQQQNSGSMKMMTYAMPLLSVWIAFSVPAAVGVYWIYRSVFATLQQMILSFVMPYPKYTEEDFKAAEKEMNSTNSKKKKKNTDNSSRPAGEKKRSLHHIDDDDDDAPLPPKKEKKTIEVEIDPANAPKMKDDKGVKYEKK